MLLKVLFFAIFANACFNFSRLGYGLSLYGFPGLLFSCLCLQSLSFTSSGFNYVADNIWTRWFQVRRTQDNNNNNDMEF